MKWNLLVQKAIKLEGEAFIEIILPKKLSKRLYIESKKSFTISNNVEKSYFSDHTLMGVF